MHGSRKFCQKGSNSDKFVFCLFCFFEGSEAPKTTLGGNYRPTSETPLKCLAQGPQRSDAGEARTRGPIGLESSTLPLRSLSDVRGGAWGWVKNYFFIHGHVAYQIEGDNE